MEPSLIEMILRESDYLVRRRAAEAFALTCGQAELLEELVERARKELKPSQQIDVGLALDHRALPEANLHAKHVPPGKLEAANEALAALPAPTRY